MSDSPKYSQAELDRQRRQQLEAERSRKAEEEARRRREAEERERRRRLGELRSRAVAEAEEVASAVRQQTSSLYADDSERLESQCRTLISGMKDAQSEDLLQIAARETPKIGRALSEAVIRKRRDDEEKKRLEELDKQEFVMLELQRQLSEVNPSDASRFDDAGRFAAGQALSAVGSAIASGDPQAVRGPIAEAETSVRNHVDAVSACKAEWMMKRAAAERASGELTIMLEGLRADDVVMRWHQAKVTALANLVNEAQSSVLAEDFDTPASLLRDAKAIANRLIQDANSAQLKAEQRDYIASSIISSLQELGFSVGPVVREHADHPATSLIIRAAKETGEGIAVSVPVEGEVMYDVGGYPMNTVSRVDGTGTARACDKAQLMLQEMHEALNARFGIKMGELMWEDRDPNRDIRAAEQLPLDDDGIARGGSR